MKYKVVGKTIVFDKPLRKCKDGIKILFYRQADERERSDYPIATTDAKNETTYELPTETIKLFEVLVKQPKYKFFPFIWHRWEVAECENECLINNL